MKTGIELIAEERQRQIDVEGYNEQRDYCKYEDDELAYAAAAYALPETLHYFFIKNNVQRSDFFPWDKGFWKPGDRIRELQKAGALIAAQIDVELKKQNDDKSK